jgi:hypothetical protein
MRFMTVFENFLREILSKRTIIKRPPSSAGNGKMLITARFIEIMAVNASR